MSIATKTSKISLPNSTAYKTVFAFLTDKFPHIAVKEWEQRILDGKVHWSDHSKIGLETPYQPGAILYYYREINNQPTIPFEELIIEQNDHFLIAYKPHFLPVMPGGAFVTECLQQRIINSTGIESLQAIHRLDRDTAGLVMFSTQQETRYLYHQLFADRKIEKCYQAVSLTNPETSLAGKKWHVKNQIIRSNPRFLFENNKLTSNPEQAHYAESKILCEKQGQHKALFSLKPITGKTHQLRLHMLSIGYPIVNDRFYPELQPKQPDNYEQPLKLLAKSLRFTDPISGREFNLIAPYSLEI